MNNKRAEQVALYIMYCMEDLRLSDRISLDVKLSDEAMDEAKALIDSGFIPTEAEIREAVLELAREYGLKGLGR